MRSAETSEKCLQEGLRGMWIDAGSLDPDKAEVLLESRRSGLGLQVSPVLEGRALPQREQAHGMGVLLDRRSLRLVRQLWPFQGRNVLATVVLRTLHNPPHYCNTFSVGRPLRTVPVGSGA